jgi:hypothetical protein
MKNKLILVISVIAAGLVIAACGTRTVVIPAAATPTVTVTPGSAPAPQTTTVAPGAQAPAPAAPPPSDYAQDIASAGIVAPLGWLTTTGDRLCADWRNGESTAQTDQLLLAGGIHLNHLGLFDSITNSDVCPDVTP